MVLGAALSPEWLLVYDTSVAMAVAVSGLCCHCSGAWSRFRAAPPLCSSHSLPLSWEQDFATIIAGPAGKPQALLLPWPCCYCNCQWCSSYHHWPPLHLLHIKCDICTGNFNLKNWGVFKPPKYIKLTPQMFVVHVPPVWDLDM